MNMLIPVKRSRVNVIKLVQFEPVWLRVNGTLNKVLIFGSTFIPQNISTIQYPIASKSR